jgi:hypothetical protein
MAIRFIRLRWAVRRKALISMAVRKIHGYCPPSLDGIFEASNAVDSIWTSCCTADGSWPAWSFPGQCRLGRSLVVPAVYAVFYFTFSQRRCVSGPAPAGGPRWSGAFPAVPVPVQGLLQGAFKVEVLHR